MTTDATARTLQGTPTGSALEGDRACAQCGFNLIGQAIVREAHYGMLVARCPECGGVAPLLEYPGVSRWTRRLIGLIAALWALALLGVSVGSGGAMFGITIAGASEASDELARFVEYEYSQSDEGKANAASGATGGGGATPASAIAGPSPTPAPRVVVHSSFSHTHGGAPADWVAKQDLGAILRKHGGWAPLAREYGVLFVPLAIVSLVAGVFLGLCVLHQRRWRLALIALMPVAVCAAFIGLAMVGQRSSWSSAADNAAFAYVVPRAAATTAAFGAVILMAASVFARPLARGFIRVMLPARLRAPLGPLWEADGLPPPGGRASSRRPG